MGGGGVCVHPNQSGRLPPVLAGPTDSCGSGSQLEPSLPPADKRLRLVQHSQHHSIPDSGSKGWGGKDNTKAPLQQSDAAIKASPSLSTFFWGGVFFKMSMHRTIPPPPAHRMPRKAERRVVKNGLNEGVPFEKLIISCLAGFLSGRFHLRCAIDLSWWNERGLRNFPGECLKKKAEPSDYGIVLGKI